MGHADSFVVPDRTCECWATTVNQRKRFRCREMNEVTNRLPKSEIF